MGLGWFVGNVVSVCGRVGPDPQTSTKFVGSTSPPPPPPPPRHHHYQPRTGETTAFRSSNYPLTVKAENLRSKNANHINPERTRFGWSEGEESQRGERRTCSTNRIGHVSEMKKKKEIRYTDPTTKNNEIFSVFRRRRRVCVITWHPRRLRRFLKTEMNVRGARADHYPYASATHVPRTPSSTGHIPGPLSGKATAGAM